MTKVGPTRATLLGRWRKLTVPTHTQYRIMAGWVYPWLMVFNCILRAEQKRTTEFARGLGKRSRLDTLAPEIPFVFFVSFWPSEFPNGSFPGTKRLPAGTGRFFCKDSC